MGRNPTPTALKRARGTERKSRTNGEPEPDLLEHVPDPPATIASHPEAVAEWTRTGRVLARLKLLTVADLPALECYAMEWARMLAAERAIVENGMFMETPNGYVQEHPAVSLAAKSRKAVKAFLEQFGMTPASRTKVRVPDEKGTGDPMEEYLA